MQFLGEKFLFYHHIKWVEATSCAHRAPLHIDKIAKICSKRDFQLCPSELCFKGGGIQKEQLQSNEEPPQKEPKRINSKVGA